ncbi:serine/threonine-protein kinase PCRK1-like [Rutidosis leptorrhynchoides]|uniref:serine/threonine-protein kinase PCRK1-like n=1 Tax=Rutidosis leptorrhynchoides TaxID=125765 RepID=UPI003A995950
MVFHFRCFSINERQDEVPRSLENYYTAQSDFDLRSTGSGPTSREGHIPNLNVKPGTLRVFSLDDLSKATKNFGESSKIGEGGFGSVYMGTIKRLEPPFDDIRVAVKRGKRGQKGHRQWVTEVNMLGEIKHEKLVKLIGYCSEDNGNESSWLLVYEYMPNKSLDDHLSPNSNNILSWDTRLNIARDAAIGLTYLHEGLGGTRQIIFRDFKPSNILLDENWNAKLSDFGFAREGPQDGRTHVSTSVVGTKGYTAPEYVHTGRLTSKIDVWSYGIFLTELITGRRPAAQKNSENNSECMRWVCCYAGAGNLKLIADPRLQGKYSEKSMLKLSSIADKCLLMDPKSRPTMKEVLAMVNVALVLENQHVNGGN